MTAGTGFADIFPPSGLFIISELVEQLPGLIPMTAASSILMSSRILRARRAKSEIRTVM
jgi:hypothetical protein